MAEEGYLLIGMGGGTTSVINKTADGMVEEGRKHDEIKGIWALMNGVDGVFTNGVDDLCAYDAKNLGQILNLPGAAPGTTRTKPNDDQLDKIVDFFIEKKIKYFVYIGGNDSSQTLKNIVEKAKAKKYELKALHISKTVDNDLAKGFFAPGYPSGARSIIARAGDEWQDVASFRPRTKVDVVMGRYSGWLAEAAKLTKAVCGNGPNLVYTPERMILEAGKYEEVVMPGTIKQIIKKNVGFDLFRFMGDVRQVLGRDGYAHIVVSESLKDYVRKPDGSGLAARMVDAYGNENLTGDNVLGDYLDEILNLSLGLEPRTEPYGYWVRSNMDYRTQADVDGAKMLGVAAVKWLMEGETAQSLVLEKVPTMRAGEMSVKLVGLDGKPTGDSLVPQLKEVGDIAEWVRFMPEEYVSGPADPITAPFKHYLEQILYGESKSPKRGFAKHLKLGNHLLQ